MRLCWQTLWLASPDGGRHGPERAGAGLSGGASEYVLQLHQLHIREASVFDSIQVLSLQERAANSSSPEADL